MIVLVRVLPLQLLIHTLVAVSSGVAFSDCCVPTNRDLRHADDYSQPPSTKLVLPMLPSATVGIIMEYISIPTRCKCSSANVHGCILLYLLRFSMLPV
ncbi:hypothetical protein PF010_g976 [Phytophthora fragariae]|uniref:Secreted protein n=1 Tax=Phytophthora fragariae TaxID=53985 RepID=A0A6A3IBL5_9STRA|nr:hypothetical protein PF011_g22459 [Phytophthora fragariae]KAE9138359.1 hypothetical protein PF010_g976 [Phytophthora fragariae]KAE9188197.1 hypothetical protein PF004_g22575 [Phytophthora fragariae]KAE9322735.1 hypothetical protein PF008_g17524 [Phytophthora fragariae]